MVSEDAIGDVKAIEKAIEALPPAELAEFGRWFAEYDGAARDKQLEVVPRAASWIAWRPKCSLISALALTASLETYSFEAVLAVL